MSVNANGAWIYFQIFGINITQTVLSVLLVSLTLGIGGYLLGKNLKKRPGKLQVLTEKGVLMLKNMVVSTMGEHNVGWVPYIGTIFLSSILGSYIGLLGFFRSSTADLSVPLTWGIMTSVLIWYHTIKRNGFLGFLKGFTEPIWVMTPMNIISEIAQPISLAFRHFGNVAGGGVINSILYTALGLASSALIGLISKTIVVPIVVLLLGIFLIARGVKNKKTAGKIFGIIFVVLGVLGILENLNILSGIPILQFGIPAVLSIYFDLFSGFVQAFVFSLLSMAYIAGACPPPEEVKQ